MSTKTETVASILVPTEVAITLARCWKVGHDTYFKKGGIADLRSRLEELSVGEGSLGHEMLKAGRLCLQHAHGDAAHAASVFAGACAQAEETAKQAAKARNEQSSTTQLLPNWTPNKSVIKAALSKGFNLLDEEKFPNITAVRKVVAARGAGGQTNQQGGANQRASDIKVTPKLAAVMDAVSKTIASLPEDQQDIAADLLMKFHAELIKLRPDTTAKEAKQEATAIEKEIIQETTAAAEPAPSKRERAKRGGSRAAA